MYALSEIISHISFTFHFDCSQCTHNMCESDSLLWLWFCLYVSPSEGMYTKWMAKWMEMFYKAHLIAVTGIHLMSSIRPTRLLSACRCICRGGIQFWNYFGSILIYSWNLQCIKWHFDRVFPSLVLLLLLSYYFVHSLSFSSISSGMYAGFAWQKQSFTWY